jgi:death-on-curing protein
LLSEPIWLTEGQITEINQKLAAKSGEPHSVRDADALAGAVARPRALWTGGEHDMVSLAGALLLALGREHPFAQGNSGTALLAATIFLQFNGYAFVAPDGEPVGRFVALAIAGTIPNDVFMATLRKCTIPTAEWDAFRNSRQA